MRRRPIMIIATVVALLAGAAYGQDDPDPELARKQATEQRLMVLLQLKERADRAEIQQEKAEWAKQGQAMVEKAEWAQAGRYMVGLDHRAGRAEAQQEKAGRVRKGLYLGLWTDYVQALSETPEATENALWYSPVGLMFRDATEAVRRGDPEALDQIEEAGELAARAEARREAIQRKNSKLQ